MNRTLRTLAPLMALSGPVLAVQVVSYDQLVNDANGISTPRPTSARQ